ncbi:MAG: fibronectin type III-like domain-contianing protein, partial [Bifidobacteriaceae bacterium]|nr:fibronectin type III-like domain-contianing protein [Bifidobacteriaceae bacterium]
VALFGVGAYRTIAGGTGSGSVNQRYTIHVRTGVEEAGYTVTTAAAYGDELVTAADAIGGGGMTPPNLAPAERPLDATTVLPTAPTDIAIFVPARSSGEFADRPAVTPGDGNYYLNATERANLELIARSYPTVIVALNVGGIVDTAFYQEINSSTQDPAGGQGLDSLLLMSQPGQEAGRALVDVISGTANPSGKLTDSWASSYAYYPASATFAETDGISNQEWYKEGIYVGYRYFDSFYRTINPTAPDTVVTYPFGYGLSYSTFDVRPETVSANSESVTVTATVQNTGDVAGKEVVQVYFSAPQKGLDKPYQELAGFAKTDLLQPGQQQKVTIAFKTTEMSSYDPVPAAYVLEGGDYVIRVGDSSRATHVAAVVQVPNTLITEQLHNEMDNQANDDELVSDPADFYSYDGEAAEIASAKRIPVSFSKFAAPNNSSDYEQNVPADSTSPYYAIDGRLVSSTTALIDSANANNWEASGAAYAPREGETTKLVTVTPNATLYDVAKGSVTMEDFVAGLTLEQLAHITQGASSYDLPAGQVPSTSYSPGAPFNTTARYENLGIAAMSGPDGPAGLRLTQSFAVAGTTYYQFTTAWPISTMRAQTWNTTLLDELGEAVGKEMVEYGSQMWLAPGMNIHRDPRNGRNFEYYSEDPLLTGETATAITLGVQSNPGVGVTLKHYAGNNQETNRGGGNDTINERALREIYLKGFEIAVKSAQPMAVMTAFNRINGECADWSYDLDTDLLRGEWGFDGLVMTDYGSCSNNPIAHNYAGVDLVEPGGGYTGVINAMRAVPPSFDVWGFPVFSYTEFFPGFGSTTYAWGGFNLSTTGAETESYMVNDSSIASAQMASRPVAQIPGGSDTFADAQAAYDAVTQYIAALPTGGFGGLTANQKASISTFVDLCSDGTGPDNNPSALDPCPTGNVSQYTVTLTGYYNTGGMTLRLGDLQRSATRVLNTVTKSAGFQELADLRGIAGIDVQPYSSLFDNLADYVSTQLATPTAISASTVALEELVDSVRGSISSGGLKGSDYTTATWAALEAALAAAQQVAQTIPSTEAQVATVTTAVQQALNALVRRGAPAGVNAALAVVRALEPQRALFSPSSWAAVAAAATQARALVANGANVNQSQLDAAAARLTTVIGSLVLDESPRVDAEGKIRQVLSDLVTAAQGVTQADYEATSWTALQAPLANARAVLASPSSSAAAVQAALDSLAQALASLKPAVRTVTEKIGPEAPAPVSTKTVKVSAKAFKKGSKPKVTVSITLTAGSAKGRVALYANGKKVKTVKVIGKNTVVQLPKTYSKAIKVKAKYIPKMIGKNGTRKNSASKTVTVKK